MVNESELVLSRVFNQKSRNRLRCRALVCAIPKSKQSMTSGVKQEPKGLRYIVIKVELGKPTGMLFCSSGYSNVFLYATGYKILQKANATQ